MAIIFDIETTSLNPSCAELVTFYAKSPDDELYLSARVNVWSYQSEKIHKITFQSNQESEYDQSEAFFKIQEYLEAKAPDTLVLHANYNNNGQFYYYDVAIILNMASLYGDIWRFRNLLNKFKILSTHTMAKDLLNLSRYGLNDLCDYFDIELNHHDVRSDVKATERLYHELQKELMLRKENYQRENQRNPASAFKENNKRKKTDGKTARNQRKPSQISLIKE